MINHANLCSLQPYNCTSCNKGYCLDKNECFLCYERCETCSSGVKDINNQNCLSCKEGYVLFENNCIDKCPEGYIEKNKICEICDPLCKTRGDNCDHCTSCFDGYYIDEIEFKCKKCNELCKTCLGKEILDDERCETCNTDSKYKYLVKAEGYGSNCVSICPEGTEVNGIICVLSANQKNGDNKNNNGDNSVNTILIVLSASFGSLFIIVLLICLIQCKRRKNQDAYINFTNENKIMNDINKDT